MKALIYLFMFTSVGVHAQTKTQDGLSPIQNFQAGIHYEFINPAWSNQQSEPVVYEFFSYMCPGCNAFEPIMERLESSLTEDQTIIRVPVSLYPQWEPHAKAYYTLEMMGELDRVHTALFAAIHLYKKQLRTIEDIAAWVASSFGIDQHQFIANAKSFVVDSKIRKSQQMIAAMGINRIPSLVVNGQKKLDFQKLQTPENIIALTADLMK